MQDRSSQPHDRDSRGRRKFPNSSRQTSSGNSARVFIGIALLSLTPRDFLGINQYIEYDRLTGYRLDRPNRTRGRVYPRAPIECLPTASLPSLLRDSLSGRAARRPDLPGPCLPARFERHRSTFWAYRHEAHCASHSGPRSPHWPYGLSFCRGSCSRTRSAPTWAVGVPGADIALLPPRPDRRAVNLRLSGLANHFRGHRDAGLPDGILRADLRRRRAAVCPGLVCPEAIRCLLDRSPLTELGTFARLIHSSASPSGNTSPTSGAERRLRSSADLHLSRTSRRICLDFWGAISVTS